MDMHHGHSDGHTGGATDPVCQMSVDPANPPGGSFEFEGTTYHFCNPGCNERFQKAPKAFLEN